MSNPRIPQLPQITTKSNGMKLPIWNEADDKTYHINVSDLVPEVTDTSSISYNPLTVYAADSIVVFDDQLYVSLVGSNVGNIPSTSPTQWQLGVKVPAGLRPHQVGIYTDTEVSVYVTVQGALRIARLINPTRPFNSSNFLTELAANSWQLEGYSAFKGYFVSLGALNTAFPTANAGDYAIVDSGVGVDATKYIWDTDDIEWIISGGAPVASATEVIEGITRIADVTTAQTASQAVEANRNHTETITARGFRWAFETMLGVVFNITAAWTAITQNRRVSNTTLATTQFVVREVAEVIDLGVRTGSITIDLATGTDFLITQTGNLTINFSNETIGKQYTVEIYRETTNFTLTLTAARYAFPIGLSPVLTDPSSSGLVSPNRSTDVLSFKCYRANRLTYCGMVPNVQNN